ncbi:MAG: hypothetical protein P8O93_08910 [Flavobacteriaceae bacterium]|nr:hypothetical protein [Flavobacteriaceae bacterium]
MNFLSKKRSRPIAQENDASPITPSSDSFASQTIEVGRWSYDSLNKTAFLDQNAKRLLDLPAEFRAPMHFIQNFCSPNMRSRALQAYQECLSGKPFTMKVDLVPVNEKPFHALLNGIPDLDENGGVKGVSLSFHKAENGQDFGTSLPAQLEHLTAQNKQLIAFSEHISRQFRSGTSNLALTLELLNDSGSEDEKQELVRNMHTISKGMTNTVEELNQMIQFYRKPNNLLREVSFQNALNKATTQLDPLLQESDTDIFSDFSEIPVIKYHGDFLEKIFVTLIKHAVVNKIEGRRPALDIFTYYDDQQQCLLIKDNSQGQLLMPAHVWARQNNPDQHDDLALEFAGIKLQIEALNGSISVEGNSGIGTTVRIKF